MLHRITLSLYHFIASVAQLQQYSYFIQTMADSFTSSLCTQESATLQPPPLKTSERDTLNQQVTRNVDSDSETLVAFQGKKEVQARLEQLALEIQRPIKSKRRVCKQIFKSSASHASPWHIQPCHLLMSHCGQYPNKNEDPLVSMPVSRCFQWLKEDEKSARKNPPATGKHGYPLVLLPTTYIRPFRRSFIKLNEKSIKQQKNLKNL